ncbi:MAG: hypothetical protein EOM52_00620 [Clostridia bacterium]|nr:hypothetical protein [Clostridia bacterium]
MKQRDRHRTHFTAGKRGPAVSVFCAAALIALLMCLSLGQLVVKAYLIQDGFAVPADTLDSLLRSGEPGSVALVSVDMGEAVYTRSLGNGTYYVGEEKRAISADYPLYTQSGQVLAFLNDASQMITSDWDALTSYEGLYLSDGVTFNADRSQADIAEVLLVRVNGGYLTAQAAEVNTAGRTVKIPMNSVCVFDRDGVLFYAYEKGSLLATKTSVAPGATIAVGPHSYGYLDFLEKLGLWEEENPAVTPQPIPAASEEPTPSPTPIQSEVPEIGGNPAGSAQQPAVTTSAEPAESKDTAAQPSRRPGKPGEAAQDVPKPPTGNIELPGAPIENPDASPERPAPPVSRPDPNPGYREPSVSFNGGLTAWVYTLTTNASIYDPSEVLEGGVQIYVYEVKADGKETQAMRRIITASGEVVLGQLKPGTEYRVAVSYRYRDKLNYPQDKSLDLGKATTLPFDQVGSIRVSFYDEYTVQPGAAAVEIFSNSLQLRSLVFNNVSNGTVTEVGGVKDHPATNLGKAETYVNAVTLTAAAVPGGGKTELKMPTDALRLLREGFTLGHWETPDSLRSSTEYTHTLRMTDRYGNEFTLDGTTQGAGHTCMETPEVSILVPDKTNLAGSTQVQVTWKNPDAAEIGPNPGETATMGKELIAGLYLVEQGKTVTPENAVELTAYPAGQGAEKTVTGRFLPVTVNSDGQVTTVATAWEITNLQVLKGYTAAVLCGHYEIKDGKSHYDETLQKTTDFLTASLSNLGTISYTAEVDQLSYDTGRLKFRMNSADERLLALLDQVTFTVEKKGVVGAAQSFLISRDDWDKVMLTPAVDDKSALYTASVQVPVHLNGAAEARTATLTLTAKNLPTVDAKPTSAWGYLLASAATGTADEFWFTFTLGGELSQDVGEESAKLLTLEPRTSYVGRFSTTASQGGVRQDVISGSSRTVNFTTLSREALVSFTNAFVSTDFIELYDVSIRDLDSCIRPDDADRGGGNVLVKVLSEGGTQVTSRYVNSVETQASLRLGGLEKGRTYTLIFTAVKYADGGTGAVELNRNLGYAEPQNTEKPWIYTFTTGESVVGELNLTGVTQLYQDNSGKPTDSLGLLTEDDFYYNVWQYGNRVYYYDGDGLGTADKDQYLAQIGDKEITDELKELAEGTNSAAGLQIRPLSDYTSDTNVQSLLQDSWTSRFIEVAPGEQYTVYSPNFNSYAAITFYYRDTNGNLRYYGAWNNSYYLMGSVFRIPTTEISGSGNADRICYMRIASYNRNSSSGLVLEQYDSARTALSRQLVDSSVRIVEGMYLNTGNGLSFDQTYAYTSDYIPVTGGSFYELKGRDPNKDEAASQNGSNGSSGRVLFYNSDYVFLGSYDVSYQTSVIRAPFGAAYCRFNLSMKQREGQSPAGEWPDLSMKLYRQVIRDRYQATLQVRLTDQSETQLLRAGSYSVTLYTTTASVSDSDDLSAATYVQLGDPQTFTVGAEDMKDGKLDLSSLLRFNTLNPNMGFKAILSISPVSWKGASVLLDTVYFTTNRVVRTIGSLADLKAIRNDPAGSYVVTADISHVTGQILGGDRPFTGVIDFQGHTVSVDVFTSLFDRVSTGGVVKNLVLEYNATATTATSAYGNIGALVRANYGTIQNLVLRLNPDNKNFGADFSGSGGIARYNYGTIDGFVVQFMKDIRVTTYFGGICSENFGSISNGYVCGAVVDDENGTQHTARLVHVYKDENNQVVSTESTYVALGVGRNTARGSIRNVFVLGDLVVQSADASSDYANADYKGSGSTANSAYETSTTNTAYAGLLTGSSAGTVQNVYTAGDRLDQDAANNRWSYMLDRGPAVTIVTGRYDAEGLTYFSNSTTPYSLYSSSDGGIAGYNVRGEMRSLYDYQWQQNALGTDGSRFSIRGNVESGYYPQLVLPDCFPAGSQPRIELPSLTQKQVEVLYNEVRLQGVREAAVTVSLDFPYAPDAKITGFTVVDRYNAPIQCEILAQRAVAEGYRVDILLSLPEDGSALADSSYTITGATWTGGRQTFTGQSGTRDIRASFWREISSNADWKTYFSGATNPVYGNYLLTADLDFSASTVWSDWYCGQAFYGTLDGADYTTVKKELTSETGEVLKDSSDQPRTIEVWESASELHTISGVGNLIKNEKGEWTWITTRDATYRSSLFYSLRGTVRNLVFRDFRSGVNPGYATNSAAKVDAVNSGYAGVVARADAGASMENCHVRDSVFYGNTWVGGLLGYGSGTGLRDCSARKVAVNTFRRVPTDTATVSAGGLVGGLDGGLTEGCFAADVTVTAADVYAANGVGGLVGYAASSGILSSYTTGTVDAAVRNVGGIAGQITGDSNVTGCWSAASVTTVSDYAGGVVGYHAGGRLVNNYTTSTIITRALAAGSVHRICSATDYNENDRHDNYAFQGQYLTYFDANPPEGESHYQFGVWEEEDGATALLDQAELKRSTVWTGMIGIGDGYDLDGTAVSGGLSGGSAALGVGAGYMPKLVSAASGQLLYDQPDVEIGYVSTSALSRVGIKLAAGSETLTVTLVLFSERSDILQAPLAELANWAAMAVTGGAVDRGGEGIYGVKDLGAYSNPSLDSRSGRAFSFTVKYGAAAGSGGHYLDSYILTLPVYDGEGGTELLQARLSVDKGTPVYKVIYSIEEWDRFFSDPQYANAYENVEIGWPASVSESGVIDFSKSGVHQTNVKVNRLSGIAKEGTSGQSAVYPTLKGLDITFTTAGQSLINQAVTEVSNLNFADLKLSSSWTNSGGVLSRTGGDMKGVIGQLQGDMRNVTFRNIDVDGGSGGMVGCIGAAYGTIDSVVLENIKVQTTGNFVGGFVGQVFGTGTVSNVSLSAETGQRNSVTSLSSGYTGGLFGRVYGVTTGLSVDKTEVKGIAYVGGAVGAIASDGSRQDEIHLSDVTVGDPAKVSDTPGVSSEPSVTVTLDPGTTTNSSMRYGGGVVGHDSGMQMRRLNAYNTRVGIYAKASNDGADNGTYNYYLGGLVGASGGSLREGLAENCTVVTYDSCAGGISGNSMGWYNTARRCVVYGLSENTQKVGGLVGSGGAERGLAENCVVLGGARVGGAAGAQTGIARESGAVDCVVLGDTNVGGLSGFDTYYHFFSNYVTSSLGSDGQPTVTTKVTREMLTAQGKHSLPGYLSSYVDTQYRGSAVLGKTNVGGLVGSFAGVTLHNSWVGSGVTVTGDANVGGLAGQYYGWYDSSWNTTNRSLYACAMGAEVTGKTNVGGVAGEYTRTPGSTTVATADSPQPNYFYGILITGGVSGQTNTALLIPGVPNDGSQIKNCRIWKDAKLSGVDLNGLGAWNTDYGTADAKFEPLLTATAEDLSDSNLYFLPLAAPYGGMGWNRYYWGDETMEHLYPETTEKADFQSYKKGIDQENLVLWLDARNNTGSGYTDPAATTWSDLTSGGNNAVLYWNNKSAGSSFTINERATVMRWNEGALEFPSTGGNNAYYAQLEKSISGYLQSGYTVELVYSYVSPVYNGNLYDFVLGWKDGAATGGFRTYYNATSTAKGNIYFQTDVNSTGGGIGYTASGPAGQAAQRDRTVTLVAAPNGGGKDDVTAYVSGEGAGSVKNASIFRSTDEMVWRIGFGPNSNAFLRISGIRVYNKPLSEEQVKKNADYDAWYYFGGTKPADAGTKTEALKLNADGSVGAPGTYKLLRSEDGNYNGTLVTAAYSGGALGSRGYYYLMDAAGNVSNVVQKTAPGFGPVLRTQDLGNEYYGTPRNYFVRGQEGTSPEGETHNTDDRLYYGGYLLPDAGTLDRSGRPATTFLLARAASSVPALTVYASGVDTVNLELGKDAPEGLAYTVSDGGGKTLLEGTWPEGGRTLTMTWDFLTPFTVQLALGAEMGQESQWSAGNLAGTVMTYGNGWWYLYGSECYDSAGNSLDPTKGFVHMMDGLLLDDEGELWRAEDLSHAGHVTPFRQAAGKPLWSGSVAGTAVESYGTYLISEGGVKETQLVVKGDRAYTMPASKVTPGGFVVDAYGGDVYTTVLGSDGTLCDMGAALAYPKDFAATGIREISNTLNYSGHTVLVRYRSGMLAAFDYLTGESFEVFSRESEGVSLMEFMLSSFRNLSRSSALTGGAEQALAAVEYQGEVDSDPSLRTALVNLKDNGENTSLSDGGGSGVYAEGQPGGVDGQAGAGSDADSGLGDVLAPEQTVTPGGDVPSGDEPSAPPEPGTAMEPGTAVESGPAMEPGTATESGTAAEPEKTIKPEAAEPSQAPVETEGPEPEEPQASNPPDGEGQNAAEGPSGNASSPALVTRYVTVYDADKGESSVYDLEELLIQKPEELITQEERSEELEKLGFTTSLMADRTESKTAASGMTLMLLVSGGIAVLLCCMILLKKRRLDGEEP